MAHDFVVHRHNSPISMHCPVCNKTFQKEESTALPFCSERCRTIDLGRWLGEVYGMPAVPDPEADELPEPLHDNGNVTDAAE